MKISVYIIAYNEGEKIRDCINSGLWADEIIVADSHSTDGTTEIASKLGARVIHIPFKGYGDLRNQAISHCTGDWIFSLDSDERCSKEVRDEILELISQGAFADTASSLSDAAISASVFTFVPKRISASSRLSGSLSGSSPITIPVFSFSC